MTTLRAVLTAAVLTALAGTATAGPKPRRINLKPILDKLWVLQTDSGHQVLLVPPWERKAIRAMKLKQNLSNVVLFGKNRKYHQLRVFSSSSYGTKRFEKWFTDGRVRRGGKIRYDQGVITLHCGKRKTKLTLIEGDRRRRILHASKFYTPKWQRRADALARDNLAKYYYVDRLNKKAGGQGYRLFIGPKGALKRVGLRDVAQDSEGSVFATRKGSLVLSRSTFKQGRYWRTKYEIKWVSRRGKVRKLKWIPPNMNQVLIYRDLGVYTGKRFGTPCDIY